MTTKIKLDSKWGDLLSIEGNGDFSITRISVLEWLIDLNGVKFIISSTDSTMNEECDAEPENGSNWDEYKKRTQIFTE
jgi:hypothetical protein